jgi:hypothetical protein
LKLRSVIQCSTDARHDAYGSQRTLARLTLVTALVFVGGFLMQMYGLYFRLLDGALLSALGWVAGGLVLQVASGARSRSGGTVRLVNPLVVLRNGLRDVRGKVRSWE